MIKLGNCDTWNKEKFRFRSCDLMNDDIFISLLHVKRMMKNFWATVWKYFVINMLFKIVLTKHSFCQPSKKATPTILEWNFLHETVIFFKYSHFCHLKYLKTFHPKTGFPKVVVIQVWNKITLQILS